jgi:GTPase SAR1 family protein
MPNVPHFLASLQIPVIVAGNKMDLQPPTPTSESQQPVRARQQLVALLQRFRFVRQCIKCSAKNLVRVELVFERAQHAVLYPFAPLFDLAKGKMTTESQKAFERIFRIYDQDHDGLLSNAELDTFQYQTFHLPLVERDLRHWKKVVARNYGPEVIQDGKFTVAGFLSIFDTFISQNRLDVPWKVLDQFGYTHDLELIVPQEKLKKVTRKLSQSARHFLTALFTQFDADKDGVLQGHELQDIFSILPEPSLPPWHALRAGHILDETCFSMPTSGRSELLEWSVSASGITIASSTASLSPPDYTATTLDSMTFWDWMGHWHMMAAISPRATRAELYRLGHVVEDSKRNKRSKEQSPPSKELNIYVVGSDETGKTSLVRRLCDKQFDASAPLQPTALPETSTTHKIFRRTTTEGGNEFVVHFILTEVPRSTKLEDFALAMSSSTKPLVLFIFNSEKSLFDAIELENELLDDDIARVFLMVKEGEEKEETIRAAAEHCRELDLEPPFVTNVFEKSDRDSILEHLARCGLEEADSLRSKPHAEQKKREAARRRKMIWLGGLVSVAVAVGVGVLWGSVVARGGEERKVATSGRLGWLADFLFGRRNAASPEMEA